MQNDKPFTLEICVEDAAGLGACHTGVDRITLCSALEVGGLTPSMGLMAQAKATELETHVMIRPRSGDFELPLADVETAIADIRCAKELGLAGIVLGATYDGALDIQIIRLMTQAADGMQVTLHRVVDLLQDPMAGIDQAAALGITRIVTSGGATTAAHGAAQLKAMQDHAAGRIEIMATGGIDADTAFGIAESTGITAFQATCRTQQPLGSHLDGKGFGASNSHTDEAKIADLVDTLTGFFSDTDG